MFLNTFRLEVNSLTSLSRSDLPHVDTHGSKIFNDNILYSTGHDSRKRLRSEEPYYTEKSKHTGYFLGLVFFVFL